MSLTSKAQFTRTAQASVDVKIGDMPFVAMLAGKDDKKGSGIFSTGSCGWHLNSKIPVTVGSTVGPIVITIAGFPVVAMPKTSENGNHGWNANGKVPLKLTDGTDVMVQVGANLFIPKGGNYTLNSVNVVQAGVNLTVVKSKELPEQDGGKPALAKHSKKKAG